MELEHARECPLQRVGHQLASEHGQFGDFQAARPIVSAHNAHNSAGTVKRCLVLDGARRGRTNSVRSQKAWRCSRVSTLVDREPYLEGQGVPPRAHRKLACVLRAVMLPAPELDLQRRRASGVGARGVQFHRHAGDEEDLVELDLVPTVTSTPPEVA